MNQIDIRGACSHRWVSLGVELEGDHLVGGWKCWHCGPTERRPYPPLTNEKGSKRSPKAVEPVVVDAAAVVEKTLGVKVIVTPVGEDCSHLGYYQHSPVESLHHDLSQDELEQFEVLIRADCDEIMRRVVEDDFARMIAMVAHSQPSTSSP